MALGTVYLNECFFCQTAGWRMPHMEAPAETSNLNEFSLAIVPLLFRLDPSPKGDGVPRNRH